MTKSPSCFDVYLINCKSAVRFHQIFVASWKTWTLHNSVTGHSLGPSINDIGNYSELLTTCFWYPHPPYQQCFSTFRQQFRPIFSPSPNCQRRLLMAPLSTWFFIPSIKPKYDDIFSWDLHELYMFSMQIVLQWLHKSFRRPCVCNMQQWQQWASSMNGISPFCYVCYTHAKIYVGNRESWNIGGRRTTLSSVLAWLWLWSINFGFTVFP